MGFWDKFFSMDYMLIPAILCLVFGVIYIIVATLLGLDVDTNVMFVSALLGFVLGNFIKVKILTKKEEQ